MRGKIKNIEKILKKSIESVEIFYGLKAENYKKILLGEEIPHTSIYK